MENQVKMKGSIPRADFPEQVGISAVEVKHMMDEMEALGIETHSMMLIRHGKVAFETWRAPYAPELAHTMYSVSKAITSLAVGLAVAEGLLTVDTKVIDIFPEYRPEKEDVRLEMLQIRHLLSMQSGKDVSILSNKAAGDWAGQFFNSPWIFDPGDGFKYISENTYMLCAALCRVTGMSVIDFLTPRLFAPLGITRRPFWEVDEKGIEAGGWGLFLTTEELARIVLCCQNKGLCDGKRVLPAEWLAEATIERRNSYGYCFWLNNSAQNYRMDGMFSQFGMVFPEHDACLIFTNSEINEGKVLDCIWRYFPEKGFLAENLDAPEIDTALLAYPALPSLPAKPRSGTEKRMEGKEIHFRRKMLLNLLRNPMSVLPLGVVYMSANKAGNIDKLSFRFLADGCELRWSEGTETNTVFCSMDGTERRTPILLGGIRFTALCAAAWQAEDTLEVTIRPLEAVFGRTLVFRFRGNRVTMLPSSTPPTAACLEFLADGVPEFFPNKILATMISAAMRHLSPLLEPKHKGKYER